MRNHRYIVLLLIGVMFSTGLFAQTRTIKFTGRDCTDQYHIPLSRVEVFNIDQLWQEVLYYPDTILVLGTTGVDDFDKPSGLQLRQNVPNPFDGTTHFSLSLSEDCDVWMEILDMDGKVVVKESFAALEAGTHLFRTMLESPQTYLLSASVTDDRLSIKMINKGHGGSNDISHVGMVDPNGDWTLFLKNDCANGAYPFSLGDEMRYVGYADIDGMERTSDSVIVQLQNNTTVHLKFDVTVPTVFTQSISNVTQTTATCGGSVSDNGGAAVTARGVCWNTLQNPTVNGSHTTDGAGEGSFVSSITGLVAGNTYYVRAYATNAVGTAYGAQTSFTTISTVPTVSTTSISNITANSATCHSNVTDDGGTAVTARGVCWSTSQNPTISNSHTNNGSGSGNFHSDLTDLSANTTYYVRAYATNSVGTAYGNQVSFNTYASGVPTVTTNTVTNITATTAVCGGDVTDAGSSSVTARGVCWSTSQNPTISNSHTTNGSGTGGFTSNITLLTANTTYYVRAYATNSAGTGYGAQKSFTTTPAGIPTVTTNAVSNIAANTAVCGGNVTATGGATVTARGVCWSTSQNPTISNNHTTNGNGTGSFTSNITGLTAGTTYYVRAYATNSSGTAYGEQMSFTTISSQGADVQPCPNAATVTDYDGNVYNTVLIGQQCWMKENLRTTRYANGNSIALGSGTSTETAYRYYPANSSATVSIYGYLYNWMAVMGNYTSSSANPSGVQGICPDDWHVPSDAEWTQLTNYVSSQSQYVCGFSNAYIAKAMASTMVWSTTTSTCAPGNSPSTNNTTGFSALPAGEYTGADGFDYFPSYANFWSSTQDDTNHTWYRSLFNDNAYVWRDSEYKGWGCSVRCVKD